MHISASQIKSFLSCQRGWAFSRTAERADTCFTSFGKKVHSLLEGYYQTGVMGTVALFHCGGRIYDPVKVASGMLAGDRPQYREIPTLCEMEFSFVHEGIEYMGFIDLIQIDAGTAFVVDHKTSSNPAKWGVKPDALPYDIQNILYTEAVFRTYPDIAYVVFALNYGDNKTGKGFIVRGEPVSRYVSSRQFDQLHIIGKQMKKAHEIGAIDNPMLLEHNIGSCGDYGGCPYYNNGCILTAAERLKGVFTMPENKSELIKKLLAKAKAKAEAEEVQQEPETEPETATEAEEVQQETEEVSETQKEADRKAKKAQKARERRRKAREAKAVEEAQEAERALQAEESESEVAEPTSGDSFPEGRTVTAVVGRPVPAFEVEAPQNIEVPISILVTVKIKVES